MATDGGEGSLLRELQELRVQRDTVQKDYAKVQARCVALKEQIRVLVADNEELSSSLLPDKVRSSDAMIPLSFKEHTLRRAK